MERPLRNALVAVMALVALVPGGCRRDPVLATLGGRSIRESDLRRYLETTHTLPEVEAIRHDPSQRQAALDAFLDSLAVAARAHQLGLDGEERFRKAVELLELKTLAHQVTEQNRDAITLNTQVTPDEVRAYYEQHKHEMLLEPRFTARYLLVYVKGNPAFPEQGLADAPARAKAQQALARLRAGQSWDAVARLYSDDVPTRDIGGVLRDREFGRFAPEVERAFRTQELGKPGEVIRSAFGYHVIQVEQRRTEPEPRPFDELREGLTERLTRERSDAARSAFMTPIQAEIGFQLMEAGQRDGYLLEGQSTQADEVLAEVGGRKIREADFQWFVKDALMPRQRAAAASRPGARVSMVRSFLDMLVLEAKARRLKLDRSPEFIRARTLGTETLLLEFLQERDKTGPLFNGDQTPEQRQQAQRDYLAQVRTKVGLTLASAR